MNFKKLISLSLALVLCLLTLASCDLASIFQGFGGTTTAPDFEVPTSTTTTKNDGGDIDPDVDNWDELYDIITIADALEIAQNSPEETVERYYVAATIVSVSNPTYGEMTIADETGEIYVYGSYSEDGSLRYSEMDDKPLKGDKVLLHVTLQYYNGELLQVKNARIIDFIKADKEDIDVSDYTEMTIAAVRDAEVGAKASVTGVVARITYSTGMNPSGVYLIDGTNSIYVYDGDIAGQVSIGNKITVLGSKAYWVLESETNNAEKHGYKGCCQLEDAVLYENDNQKNEIDLSWCSYLSVKDILEIPVSENVTTTVFKTTALVKKVPGTGFTNYYFYDLDGKTGAYTYTQCSGSDFAWLDEFDGKICTVYISPMNAKSTTSDCYFRFLPIAVIDEGFTFDLSKAPEHAVKYYGLDQFISHYTGNPLLEVVTSVSSELLGFENVSLTYASSNVSVAYFEEVDGKTVFNCVEGANGESVITVSATYGEYSYTESFIVSVGAASSDEVDTITVGEAFAAPYDELLTIEGIVGPSLVNQSGFYLIDSTGAIAVRVDASAFEGLGIGQHVIIQGTKTITKEGAGQICIDNASIIVNKYGAHDYSTETFIEGKTLADLVSTEDTPEATLPVYVITATVEVVETAFFTNIKIVDGNTSLTLYCSGANQYSWLKQFANQEVTMEIALCDWNAKGLKGAVLSVITEDGKVLNNYNFSAE